MKMSLLSLLEEKGIRSTAQLAAELGTSMEMIEAKLERYAQLGYVKKTVMSANCGGNCKKCHGCSGMKNAAASVVYWERIK
jgi:predicted transcriptional regulator